MVVVVVVVVLVVAVVVVVVVVVVVGMLLMVVVVVAANPEQPTNTSQPTSSRASRDCMYGRISAPQLWKLILFSNIFWRGSANDVIT